MERGWRYWIVSVLGTAGLTTLSVWLVNRPLVQQAFAAVPFFGIPALDVLQDAEILFAISTTLVVVLAAMWPMFKPRLRRILEAIFLTQMRILSAMVGLAALGYFKWSGALS